MRNTVPETAVPGELVDLVGDIYQAAWEPSGWEVLLGKIASVLKADAGVLFTPAEGMQERFLFVNHRLPEDWMRLYGEYYWQHDVWTVSAQQKNFLHQGAQAAGQELVASRELKGTEFYNDFLIPCGVEQTLATILFDDTATDLVPRTHLSFLRAPGREDFCEEDKALVGRLMPHFQRALVIYWQAARTKLQQLASESALDRLGQGLVLFGKNGKAVFVNGSAEKLFATADGLTLKNGVMGVRSSDSGMLDALITRAVAGVGGALLVQRPSGKPPYNLIASPLAESDRFAHLPGLPAAAVLILDPAQSRPAESLLAFARIYHLTLAETRLLELLMQNLLPKQIAAKLNLSIHTVRSQLSSLYAKTGAKGQREVIALVLRTTLAAP